MITNLISQHADRLTQAGLHFLWQGTAIAILAALVSRFLIKSPRHRATTHLLGLLALSLCVPITWIALKETPPAITPQPVIAQAIPFEASPAITAEPIPQVTPVKTPLPPSVWIVGTYLGGLALMLLRVLRGYRWSHRIRKNGTPVTEPLWTQSLTLALATMKLRAKPVMIWSEKITTPVVTGILRPMIVLPVSLMSGMPPAQATAILSHELAHLRRFDHLVVVAQRLLEALFFFHPAVWFLSRRLDQEREKACDDLVIKAGHQRADYAEALVTLASENQPALTLAAAKNTHLKERIFRILHHPQPTTVRVNRGGWLVIATSIAALVFTSLAPAQTEDKKEPKKEVNQSIAEKLQVKIPELEFKNVTIKEAIEFLRLKSVELDPDPEKPGIKFVVGDQPEGEKTIDRLVAQNFTFMEALNAICMKANLQYHVDEFAITLMPAPADKIRHRSWGVPENFIKLIAAEGIPAKPEFIEEHLKSWGVNFDNSTSATLLPPAETRDFHMLVVKNTPGNLDLIEDYIDAILRATKHGAANDVPKKKKPSELWAITFPKFSLKDATLEEAISFLRTHSREHDPAKKGVNINIFGGEQKIQDFKIKRLDLANVPLVVILDYLCNASKTRYKLEGRNISIFPLNAMPNPKAEEAQEFYLRRWITPLDFLKLLAGEGVPPKSKSIAGHLKARGVTFPNGTSASYLPSSRSLLVRNTSGNLALVDAIVGAIADPEKAKKEAIFPLEPGAQRIAKKLRIRIPVIDFNTITIEEAVHFLRLRSIELDPEPDQASKGINFVVLARKGKTPKPQSTLIRHLAARNFTFQEAIEAICQKANYRYKVDEFAITLFPKSIIQHTERPWRVPDNFIDLIAAEGIPAKPKFLKDHLKARGVTFAESTFAQFIPRGPTGPSKIVVANTPKNLVLIDAIVKSVFNPPEEEKKMKVEPMTGTLEDLNKMIFPEIRLNSATLEEVIDFLRLRALELDPAKKGVNINFFGPELTYFKKMIKKLHLDNAPLLVALKGVCEATGTRYQIEGRNISIYPIKD